MQIIGCSITENYTLACMLKKNIVFIRSKKLTKEPSAAWSLLIACVQTQKRHSNITTRNTSSHLSYARRLYIKNSLKPLFLFTFTLFMHCIIYLNHKFTMCLKLKWLCHQIFSKYILKFAENEKTRCFNLLRVD